MPQQAAYNWNPTAMQRLPKTVAEVLNRGDKDGKALTNAQRELVAEGLLSSGIAKAANLQWMAALCRHKLGVGNYPTPPMALADERHAYAMAGDRAEAIAAQIKESTR